MSRVVKPLEDYHSFRIVDKNGSELLLVGHGKSTVYLWAKAKDAWPPATFDNPNTLRQLAYRILDIVGEA